MDRLTVGLFYLLFVSANAFHTLIPEGKELVYQYRGLVRATTHAPVTYASAFILDGLLHVQTDKNSSFMHFSDLKFKLFNGEYREYMYTDNFEANEIPLPKDLEAFEQPFKVVYMDCGHAMGIVVEKDEPQYVVNMKRGLASIWQLDTHKISWKEEQAYSFHTKEHTLYGKGPYHYTVFPAVEEEWTVKKMAQPHSYHHMYPYLITNTKMSTCDAKFDQPITRDSFQEYRFVKKDDCHVMDNVESNSALYYTPYSGEGYTFYIAMNQTLHLSEVIDAPTPMTIKNEQYYKGLTYYTGDFSNMQGNAFLNGRRIYDMNKMMDALETMLCDTQKYIHEFHMDIKSPEWARGQLINRMFALMINLDETHLEEITAKLLQKTTEEGKEVLHIYYHMLPLIGSDSSYVYMMKLIKNKKVKDELAVEWLQTMPSSVKEPSKMLIEHISEMLNWGDEICLCVRKASILSVGSFIEKAIFRHNKVNHINNWSGHEQNDNDFAPDHDLHTIFPGEEYYADYITKLGEKLNACDNSEMRMVYMGALYNTRMSKAAKYLIPIVRAKLFADDQYLRYYAVKTLGTLIGHEKELTYDIFWPIMSDYGLNTNLRIAAYEQIMKTRPSLPRLNNLVWLLLNESNYAFYQYHYSYLKAITESTDPCMEEFKNSIKQIFAYTSTPEYYGFAGYYELNYMDETYNYGHQLSGSIIHPKKEHETTLQLHVSKTIENAKFNIYGLLIHVEGVGASIFDDVMLYMKDPGHNLNIEKVLKAYSSLSRNKEFKMDVSITCHGQITGIYLFDISNMQELGNLVKFFINEKSNYIKKYFNIAYTEQTHIIMPTDMGFPAMFGNNIPSVSIYDINLTKENVDGKIILKSDTILKKWSHGRTALNVYNPFVDMFQGVQRENSYHWVQSLYFDLSYNPAQDSLKVSWNRHEDPQKNVCGLKSYGASFTFFRDDMKNGLLEKSSSKSHEFEKVSYGDEYKRTHILTENDSPNTGLHYIIALYDSDKTANKVAMFNKFDFIESKQNVNSGFGHWLLTHIHAFVHRVTQPHPYANGIIVRYEPSKLHPVTNIDMNLRITREYQRGQFMLSPATKYNIHGTYCVKNKEETVNTWDANIALDANQGRTTTCVKAVISHLKPGQKDVRMCLDLTRKHVDDGIQGEATISLGHSAEAKCTDEDKIIEVKAKAEKLPDQLDNNHIYGDCEEELWSNIQGMNSLKCYKTRDSLRKWTLDFKTHKMPEEAQIYWDLFRYNYRYKLRNYLTKFEKSTTPIDKHCLRMVYEYPLNGYGADLHVYTREIEKHYSGIPAEDNLFHDIHTCSTEHFPATFTFMHKMGWTQLCEVNQQFYYNSTADLVNYEMPKEWTMYVGDAETDAKHGIWMKNLDGDYFAMKIQHGEHCLEIVPTGKKTYDIIVDGQKLPPTTYQYDGKWFWVDIVKNTGVISLVCMHTGSHIVFDGQTLLTEHPNTDMPYYGMCA